MSKNKQHKPIRYDKQSSGQSKNPAATTAATHSDKVMPMGVVAGKATLVFQAADTLFFRESRPMESMGELSSVFPPSVRTLSGAIRSYIGESHGVNWHDYASDANHPVRKIIGYSDDLGALRFEGAWLALNGERLYPAPLHLLIKDDQLYRLDLDTHGIWCDLGKQVRLPKLPNDDARGSKPLENAWVTRSGLDAVLAEKKPAIEHVKHAKDLFSRESRLGIARDNSTRSVIEGLLYQTEHIRPHKDLTIELDASGLPEDLPHQAMVRLGGEGRLATLGVQQVQNLLPNGAAGKNGLMLYLLTPLNMPQAYCLGFALEERETQTVWTGTLNGIALELHGAVTGKALREGGWDMAKHQPRAVTSLIPAGSVFFCKVVNGDTAAAINALHNQHIGTQTEYGFGHLAVGLWNHQ